MSKLSKDAIVKALQEFTRCAPLLGRAPGVDIPHSVSCDVSDALLKQRHPNGGFLVGPTMWSPKRQEGTTKIFGPAYTVQYARLDDPAPKLASHYVRVVGLLVLRALTVRQIDSVPEGSVVFISVPPNIPNAAYGGLMSTRAKALGAVGTVIDGRFRDLQEHRDLEFPVSRSSNTGDDFKSLKRALGLCSRRRNCFALRDDQGRCYEYPSEAANRSAGRDH